MRRVGILLLLCVLLAACTGDEGAEYSFDLGGANEVCDDPDACGGEGSGTATVELNSDQEEICYEISLEGVEGANASHIHEGAPGESGDPVVDLSTGVSDEGGSDCVGAEESLIEDILDDPSGYYLNVHTEDLPDGAARGQLSS